MINTGLDQLCKEGFSCLKGKRVAALVNHAAVNYRYEHALDLLKASTDVELVKILGPEHGISGSKQDMETVQDEAEVVSLYGASKESLRPNPEVFSGVDVLLVDLPDIGARYYTYAQTMAYCMEVASQAGVSLLMLDRPNPINGLQVEGFSLSKSCRSFCGELPVANRHALTLGELATAYQLGFGKGDDRWDPISVDLEVIQVTGWKRSSYIDEYKYPWVYPSPNMPTIETAVVYPGMCLFEATQISEGRGTTKPFELIGAPYISSTAWKAQILKLFSRYELDSAGFILREACFTPRFGKCASNDCFGLQIHVTNRSRFDSIALALVMIYSLKELYPEDFLWRSQAYEFVEDVPAIDLLVGSDTFRSAVDNNSGLDAVLAKKENFEMSYSEERKELLLYPEN